MHSEFAKARKHKPMDIKKSTQRAINARPSCVHQASQFGISAGFLSMSNFLRHLAPPKKKLLLTSYEITLQMDKTYALCTSKK
jgi:hypothetical protein